MKTRDKDTSLSVLLFIIGEAKSVILSVVSYFVGKIFHRSSQGCRTGMHTFSRLGDVASGISAPLLYRIFNYKDLMWGMLPPISFFASGCV
jgi:hypothetical protein